MPTSEGTPASSCSETGRAADLAAADVDLATVFELLANDLRLAIVRTLAARDGGVPFSTLQADLDVADSGRFNYHLGRLQGTLVEKTDRGYCLTRAGETVAETLAVDDRRSVDDAGA